MSTILQNQARVSTGIPFIIPKEKPKIKVKDPLRFLKYGIWTYYFLLIFEGALRKWFLPGLSSPLLIVRDPIAIILLFMAMGKRVFPVNGFVTLMSITAVLAVVTTMLLGHGNFFVALFGVRLYIIHFPLLFVIGRVFNRKDVIKIGIVTLMIAIPMTVLIALQFYSPQAAWVNRGVGGDLEGAGFSGALEYLRPPGTFSFTNGNTLFYGLVGAYVIYFWLTAKYINKSILLVATAALVLAIPLSLSRLLLAEILISMAFAFAAVASRPKYAGRIVWAAIGMLVIFIILSQVGIFQKATDALSTRFDDAENSEGTTPFQAFLDRFSAGISYAIRNADKIPFFGKGIGMGTNVGALLLSGYITFLISEGEWGRILGESGFFLGSMIILIRVVLVFKMASNGFKQVGKGNILPWMLLGFGLMSVPNGQWGQPTSLGFATMVGGLILAAFRDDEALKREAALIVRPINPSKT